MYLVVCLHAQYKLFLTSNIVKRTVHLFSCNHLNTAHTCLDLHNRSNRFHIKKKNKKNIWHPNTLHFTPYSLCTNLKPVWCELLMCQSETIQSVVYIQTEDLKYKSKTIGLFFLLYSVSVKISCCKFS